MTFEPGQKIGDYGVVAKLGAGGLGVVYEVEHLISRRREAMKIMLAGQSEALDAVERFHREVQTLATLSHVNICSLHNAFYHGNQLAMVMELVHGQTLRDRQLQGAIALPQLMDFAAQVLYALIYAHQLGVVHRDIKPSNIMITENGVVKLLDFGIARQENARDLTHAGYFVGSLSYMAPELFNGQKASPRSDIYALGVTLYELATGRLPIDGDTNYVIIRNHIEQVPVPPHAISPRIPLALSHAIVRALEKDPLNRFATAEELLQVLQQIPVSHSAGPTPQAFSISAPSSSRRTTIVTPGGPVSVPSSQAPGGKFDSAAAQSKPLSESGVQNAQLDEISRKLAVYIGPVAKFVVKKLAAQTSDIDTIYREAAKQISAESDRAAFLRSKRQ